MSGGNWEQHWEQDGETGPREASSHSGWCFQISSQSTEKKTN